MERGFIDSITRQGISGWAADSVRPDESIDVRVYLNGSQIAQITCDRPREDLRELGAYGDGRHGFAYEFSPPLPSGSEARVTIRFAKSLGLVRNGDALLKAGSQAATSVQSRRAAYLRIRPPRTIRELFQLFILYGQNTGLDELLGRVNFDDDATAALACTALFDVAEAQQQKEQKTPALLLREILYSQNFQNRVVNSVLEAYPEFQRLIFVHIPRTAGTHLETQLAERYPVIHENWNSETWFTREQLFNILAEFTRELTFSKAVLVTGHVPLTKYIQTNLLRPGDRVFSIVRDPLETALSQLNYVLTRFQANIGLHPYQPDVQDWLSIIGLPVLPDEMTPDFITEISHQLLREASIVIPNSICYWLGGGSAEAVIERLARHHVELTNTVCYRDWIAKEWGISAPVRENASTKYLTLQMLSDEDANYLSDLYLEDRKVYEVISRVLSETDRTSIFGEDLISSGLLPERALLPE
jgi:hypothetical protein